MFFGKGAVLVRFTGSVILERLKSKKNISRCFGIIFFSASFGNSEHASAAERSEFSEDHMKERPKAYQC